MKHFIISLLLSFPAGVLCAQSLALGELFNEGAVLQRDAKVAVWGTAPAGDEVLVEIQGKKSKTIAGADGNWSVLLPQLKEGGPYPLAVSTPGARLCLNEVYVGEVWIAGGQSNMGWTLKKSYEGETHVARATNTHIRFLLVPNKNYDEHTPSGDMNWRTATAPHVGDMSGVAYFFARELQDKLQVPIGIICCYKGGTAAEAWMSRDALLSQPAHAPIVEAYEAYLHQLGNENYELQYTAYERLFKAYRDSVKQGFANALRPQEPMGPRHYKRPYGLYHTMLKRIMPYTAKGVIWYQGEANAPRAQQYQTLFPALINEWRHDFNHPRLPFLFVQLANYNHPAYGHRPMWAELREAQLKTWQTVDNTAMVVAMDVGEKNDIHPIYKQPVGERLTACALHTVYGYNVPYSGPVYKQARFEEGKALLSFDFVYDGLKSEGELKGFTICGADSVFVPAHARIENEKVVVYSEAVPRPVAVRYNWANWAEGRLSNSAGFPATPFRTDAFPLLSAGVKCAKY